MTVLLIIGLIMLCYAAYFAVFVLCGLFRRSPSFPESDLLSHFIILIPAKDEESSIGSLLESIRLLDYPSELIDTCVLINHCTDRTEAIAAQFGTGILHCPDDVKTKGDVLRYAFDSFQTREETDVFVITDADNTLSPSFLREINKAIRSGADAVQCRRTGRNADVSLVSGSYEIYYRMQNAFYNRPRASLGMSASVNGTGWAVTKRLIDELGFETKTITEDFEFTIMSGLAGKRIAYVPEAVSYDTYVTGLRASMVQRLRWGYGIVQCLKLYEGRLFAKALKGSLIAWDLALVNLMTPVMAASVLLLPSGYPVFREQLSFPVFFLLALIVFWAGWSLSALLSVLLSGGSVRENIKGILGFPVYVLTCVPVFILCLFRRDIKWTAVRKLDDPASRR